MPSGVAVGVPIEPEPEVCKVCNMVGVPGCRNTLEYPSGGTILVHRGEDLVSLACPNMRVVSLRQRLAALDPQLLKEPHVTSTPLYRSGQFDRTSDDLFIRSVHYKTFLSHFKWVIASKNSGFFVRIVSDMTLLNVFVGNAAVKNRLASQRLEDGSLVVSNSLEDLLSSPDLAIIRLGHIIHPNRAAPNILREAIALRQGMGKPTWLLEPSDQVFAPLSRIGGGMAVGMPCCDDAVQRLVLSTFEEIGLEDPVERPVEYEEDEDGVSVRGSSESEQGEPDEEETEEEEAEELPTVADDDAEVTSEQAEVDALTIRRKPRHSYKRRS